jgi:N-methylhydantoinase B
MSWSSIVTRCDGATHKVPSRERFTLRTGEVIDCVTAGGGGYGDPLARPARAVLEDVLDCRVSRAAALEEYGVVLDESLQLDEAASEATRQARREARGEIAWRFDRGELGRS